MSTQCEKFNIFNDIQWNDLWDSLNLFHLGYKIKDASPNRRHFHDINEHKCCN